MAANVHTFFRAIAQLSLVAMFVLFLAAEATAAADEPTDDQIAALIQQLGDPDYSVRNLAQDKLGKIGKRAYDALTVAANDPDLEIATRARYLLYSVQQPVIRETDSDRVKEILEKYPELPTPRQLMQIRDLMGLPRGEGYRPACRLVHIENSVVMSKYVATAIINRWPVYAEGQKRICEAIEAELKQSGRTAARWLIVRAGAVADPKAGLDAWRRLVEEEESLLGERSPKSSAQIVAALLYDLACWESELGAADLAQKYFDRAQQLKQSLTETTALFYLDTAYFLRMRGKIDWAAKVYQQVSAMGATRVTPYAQLGLAEMLHDAGRNQEAAAAMDKILMNPDPQQLRNLQYIDQTPQKIQGRKHFFLACSSRDQGNEQTYRAELFQAIKEDPTEMDALIALYRLPDLEPAIRKQTITFIEAAAENLRQETAAAPDDDDLHNQFAWIVGNTTGDMQEALEHALRAVELSPESGAYLDTLAHVYFYGLKDPKKAAETQAKALQFQPHSALIRQKYDLFQKAAADKADE